MANQTNVQQLVQGLAPSGNNGNPNTTYNNSPGMPMMDAQGNWFLQNLPTAASINLQRYNTGGGSGRPNLTPFMPQLPVGGGGTPQWPTTPVVPTTPVTPPAAVVTPPSVGGGGNQSPVSIGGDGGRPGSQTFVGTPLGNLPPIGSFQGWGDVGGAGGDLGAINPTEGWGNGFSWNGAMQGADTTGGKLLEMVDKLSELYLPGDFVQQGNINWNKIGDAIAKRLGIPTQTVAKLLGQGDKYNSWLAGGYGDLKGDLRFGSLGNGNTEGYGMGQINPITGQLSLGLLSGIDIPQGYTPNSFNQDSSMKAIFGDNYNAPAPAPGQLGSSGYMSGNGSGAGTGYGSTVITGDGARAMFDGMKGATASTKTRQTGGDIYGNTYVR